MDSLVRLDIKHLDRTLFTLQKKYAFPKASTPRRSKPAWRWQPAS